MEATEEMKGDRELCMAAVAQDGKLVYSVYWLTGVGSAQAANTSAALKPLFFQRGPVIWKVGVNVALGLDVADVCCQFGKVH